MEKYNNFTIHFLTFFLSVLMISCSSEKKTWHGYSEGRYTYIAAQYSGILDKLFTQRGAFVKAGSPLFSLNAMPESTKVEQAIAQLAEARAYNQKLDVAIKFAKTTLDRNIALRQSRTIAQEKLDLSYDHYNQLMAEKKQAEANILKAKALLSQAYWIKEQKMFVAPKNALVFDTYFVTGELVPTNQNVIALLAPEDIKAVFFITEKEIKKIQLGTKVQIHSQGSTTVVNGKINFISPQPEFTPPIIYSDKMQAELVFRVEAQPGLNKAINLHPGHPITVELQTSGVRS